LSSALHGGARRRSTTTALLAGTIATLLLATAPAADAAKRMEITLQDDAVFLQQFYGNRDQAFNLASGLEVSRLRANIIWASVNGAQKTQRTVPSNPTYDFANVDGLVAAAKARGLKINLSIAGPTPAWAAGDKKLTGKGTVKPNAKLYGKFVSTVVKRYKGQVDTYSIWNEPNHKGWIQTNSKGSVAGNAKIYRALYTEGYKAAKKADRKARVWFGELAPYPSKKGVAVEPLKFLRQAFCLDSRNRPTRGRCPTLRADAVAYHPYDFARAPKKRFTTKQKGVSAKDVVTMANLGDLTKVLDALTKNKRLIKARGRGKLDVHLTEFGYFASGRNTFPESTRAKYLVDGFKIAQKNPRVKSMLQFTLVRYPGAGGAGAAFNFDTGIVNLIDNPPPTSYMPTASYTKLASYAKSAVSKGDIKNAP